MIISRVLFLNSPIKIASQNSLLQSTLTNQIEEGCGIHIQVYISKPNLIKTLDPLEIIYLLLCVFENLKSSKYVLKYVLM